MEMPTILGMPCSSRLVRRQHINNYLVVYITIRQSSYVIQPGICQKEKGQTGEVPSD